MVTSVFAGVATASTASTGIQDDDVEPADEIFVDEDGNAILVYDESDDDDDAVGEVGLDVAEGLVYVLVSDEIEDDVSGAFSMALDGDGLEGEGNLAVERPEEITDFSMDVSGTQTDEVSEFDGALDLTVDTAEETGLQGLQRVATTGEIVSTPDRLATSGDYAMEMDLAFPDESEPTGFDVAIAGHDDGYTVDVEQTRELFEFEADGWETEADAREMLEQQYGSIATELGGEATITVHEHDYQEGEDEYSAARLDLEYTIEYEGIDDAVATMLADELADDPDLDLDDETAESIADAIVGLEIETIEFSHVETASSIEGEWNVEIGNLEPLTLAMFDLFEAIEDDLEGEFDDEYMQDAIEELRASLEAQQEADLTQTASWDVAFEQSGAQTATLSAEFTSEAENWAEYVQELEANGIEAGYDLQFEATGELDGEDLVLESTIVVPGDDIVSNGLDALIAELESDPTADEETVEFLEAFDEAGLEVAAMDLDVRDGTMTFEAGAKFDDLTALEDVLQEAFDGMAVSHLYASYGDDEEAGYVYVDNLVEDGTDEDAIRATAAVDSETTIHLAGEWDEDHPRLDTDQVYEYLGYDASEEDDDGESEDNESEDENTGGDDTGGDDSTPGFGIAAALVALLAAGALIRRH